MTIAPRPTRPGCRDRTPALMLAGAGVDRPAQVGRVAGGRGQADVPGRWTVLQVHLVGDFEQLVRLTAYLGTAPIGAQMGYEVGWVLRPTVDGIVK